jgi:hypothetical protein
MASTIEMDRMGYQEPFPWSCGAIGAAYSLFPDPLGIPDSIEPTSPNIQPGWRLLEVDAQKRHE